MANKRSSSFGTTPNYNYNYNTSDGSLALGGSLMNPTPNYSTQTPVGLYNQDLSNMLSTYKAPEIPAFNNKRNLYGPDSLQDLTTNTTAPTSPTPEQGLFGSLWQGAKDFGNWATKPLSGTNMNPGKSFLDYGLSGLSGLASLYGAFKQGEYSDKMNKLAERQQSLYESELAKDRARKDLAQSRYEASFR